MEENTEQKTKETIPAGNWIAGLDDRTRKHVAFARNYAQVYGHGAPGHLDLMTIAKLADLLDSQEGS